MTPDAATRPGLEPAASLTSVRVKRRRPGVAAGGKRGDLTAEAEPEVIFAPPPEPEPAAPELLLLPPASEPAREPEPPLAELLPVAEPLPTVLAPEAEADADGEARAAPEAGELDMLDYWDSLRGARPVPALDDLDCTMSPPPGPIRCCWRSSRRSCRASRGSARTTARSTIPAWSSTGS
jgi:hypothetical protein